jgi:hypothetical protein
MPEKLSYILKKIAAMCRFVGNDYYYVLESLAGIFEEHNIETLENAQAAMENWTKPKPELDI